MNLSTNTLIYIYSKLLLFYPHSFQNEFAKEMQKVFRDLLEEANHEGIFQFLLVCLKEFGGLPFHILREVRHEAERKATDMIKENSVTETSVSAGKNRWDAFLGILPFLLAGALFMVIRFDLPFHIGYPTAAFLITILTRITCAVR